MSNCVRTVDWVKAIDLAGHNVYMHALAKYRSALMKHYMDCKAAKPEASTSNAFAVTVYLRRASADLFRGMHVLQTYSKHNPIYIMH